ncbi:MAG TPA: hypothetical protein VEV38_10925 [Candidatus Eremiobacteraceae bacterium]|nr:hypothetical protein [Candidatus Eremiobacteraceae bacterium]
MSYARFAVAFAAGTCIMSAMSGASLVLTSIPRWATVFTGMLLAACTMIERADRARAAHAVGASLCGALFALGLPVVAPPAPGAVSSRGVTSSIRGDLFDALATLDSDPNALLGKTITVTGTWTPAMSDELATVSRRIVSCCAADAVDVGFDVRLERDTHVERGRWVRIEGLVSERFVDGDIRYVLEHSKIRGLEDDASTSH